MTEFIEFWGDSDVTNALDSLEEILVKEADVFIDNSSIPWLIRYFNKNNHVKRLDFELIRKTALFYRGIDNFFSKYGDFPSIKQQGNLHLVKAIAEEFRKGTGASIGEIDKLLAGYDSLTDNAKSILGDAKPAMDEFKQVISSLYEHAKQACQDNTCHPIADALETYFCDIKSHFRDSISKASNKDVRLVARAFEKAILSDNEVYLVSEDDHIEYVTECLYSLIVCEQTNLSQKMLDRILPLKIFVIGTKNDCAYHRKFSYYDFKQGHRYSIRNNLGIHFSIGSEKGAKSIQAAQRDIPRKLRDALYSLQRHLPAAESVLEEQPAAFKPVEPIIIPPEEIVQPGLDDSNLRNTFDIIKEYARKAYENPEDTLEKEKAMNALEELLEHADEDIGTSINAEIAELDRMDLKYKIEKVDAELQKIDSDIDELRHSEQKWYDNNEKYARYKMLNEQMDRVKEIKKEIEGEMSEI